MYLINQNGEVRLLVLLFLWGEGERIGAIIKKVNLSDLPRNKKNGNIDWKNSVGCSIPFTYGELSSEVKIIKYIKNTKTPIIRVDY